MLRNKFAFFRENYKEYILIGIIFLIGMFIGVMIINNSNKFETEKIGLYLEGFITNFQSTKEINKMQLIGTSIKNNLILAISIWIAGTTIVGLPIVLAIILFRGIALGYTVAAFSYLLGKFSGIFFCIIALLAQNIICIPVIITLGVSSINLYKSIVKERNVENIKKKIRQHTIILLIAIMLLILSSIVENTVSVTVLKKVIKYF